VLVSIDHRLTDTNRYQLIDFIDWFSDHRFPSIGNAGSESKLVVSLQLIVFKTLVIERDQTRNVIGAFGSACRQSLTVVSQIVGCPTILS